MIVKFFNHGTGPTGAIEYLLNERVAEGTARCLKGNPLLTSKLIRESQNKHKYTSGVLSFEEENIEESMKHVLMRSFEDVLLPGLDRDQYNILWVEHTDKGRLELNFLIPKVELTTGKQLKPYYVKADEKRIDLWGDLQNMQYGFTDPKSISKSRSFRGNPQLPEFQTIQKLDQQLRELAANGKINNRSELISLLKQSGYKINRQSADYITIQNDQMKKGKRLKGTIYSESFVDADSLKAFEYELFDASLQELSTDKDEKIKDLTQELQRYVDRKARWNQKFFPKRSFSSTHESINTNIPGGSSDRYRAIIIATIERSRTENQTGSGILLKLIESIKAGIRRELEELKVGIRAFNAQFTRKVGTLLGISNQMMPRTPQVTTLDQMLTNVEQAQIASDQSLLKNQTKQGAQNDDRDDRNFV